MIKALRMALKGTFSASYLISNCLKNIQHVLRTREGRNPCGTIFTISTLLPLSWIFLLARRVSYEVLSRQDRLFVNCNLIKTELTRPKTWCQFLAQVISRASETLNNLNVQSKISINSKWVVNLINHSKGQR